MIAGLGNPGPAYAAHRHNVGFMAVRAWAQRAGAPAPVPRHHGLYTQIHTPTQADAGGPDHVVGVLAPTTFMNGSGASLADALAEHPELSPADVLVVHDDLDLPLGRLRLRGSGGAGGQRGLADVIDRLGTRDVPRLRIGIGRPADGVAVVDWVLSDFRPEETEPLRGTIGRAVAAIDAWLGRDLDRAMEETNRGGPDLAG